MQLPGVVLSVPVREGLHNVQVRSSSDEEEKKEDEEYFEEGEEEGGEEVEEEVEEEWEEQSEEEGEEEVEEEGRPCDLNCSEMYSDIKFYCEECVQYFSG